MLVDIVEVSYVSEYKLFIRFEDGKSGIVDIAKITPFDGVFSRLADKRYFSQVTLNKELGTIHWDNGADFAPEVLYQAVLKTA